LKGQDANKQDGRSTMQDIKAAQREIVASWSISLLLSLALSFEHLLSFDRQIAQSYSISYVDPGDTQSLEACNG
jgi:hypothetical protein